MSDSGRPSDAMQPQTKRRAGGQMTKDDFDDDDEVPDEGPGEWRPVADPDVLKRRKIVRARRTGDAPAAADAAPASAADASGVAAAAAVAAAPTSSTNPFSGISLAPPSVATAATAAPSAKPFSGISLLPPTASKEESKEPPAGAPPTSGAADATTPVSTPAAASTTFASLASTGAKPFSSWSVGGGFGSVTGNSFGSMFAAAADAKKDPSPAEAKEGADAGAPKSSPFGGASMSIPAFSFGGTTAAAFPLITPSAFGSGGAAGKVAPAFGAAAGEEEGGEDGAGGGGSVELFNSTAEFKPVVNLPVVHVDKVNEGEAENTVFSADGSLYEFESSSNKWKERGKGELRLIKDGDTANMVMRQSGYFRLLLNAKVYPAMPVQRMGEVGKSGGVTFACVNAAGPQSTPATTPASTPTKAADDGASVSDKPSQGDDTAPSSSAAIASSKLATWAFKTKSHDTIERLCTVLERAKAGELNPVAQSSGWDSLV